MQNDNSEYFILNVEMKLIKMSIQVCSCLRRKIWLFFLVAKSMLSDIFDECILNYHSNLHTEVISISEGRWLKFKPHLNHFNNFDYINKCFANRILITVLKIKTVCIHPVYDVELKIRLSTMFKFSLEFRIKINFWSLAIF